MCKIPTQDFFTNDFGLPLTMTPSTFATLIFLLLGPKFPKLKTDFMHVLVIIISMFYSLCSSTDFEDMSCEMVYGQVPPPFEEDPVSKQPCFSDICKPEKYYNAKIEHFYVFVSHLITSFEQTVTLNILILTKLLTKAN